MDFPCEIPNLSPMEPAKIDWKRIDSRFVIDSVYEHINAPKWVDFLSPQDSGDDDDDAWFCRPDCNHPKTAEDFLETTPTSKLWRSAGVKLISPLKNWKFDSKFSEDSENQNLNSTPHNSQASFFKSASEKRKLVGDDVPQLRSTLSARNLFGSKDILSHVAEFCNELKKLVTTRAKANENEEKLDEKRSREEETPRKILGEIAEMDVKCKENEEKAEAGSVKVAPRKVLGEISKGGTKEKLRRKKRCDDEEENILVSLNLENVKKNGGDERFLQIRTNPPSPQCFSTPTKTTPSKFPRSKLMEKGVLPEVKRNDEVRKDETVIYGKQARALDVFWFLNPCTLSE